MTLLVMNAADREQFAQHTIDMGLTNGYALLTPGQYQSFSNKGVDSQGLPLLGIISSLPFFAPSALMSDYTAKAAAECPNNDTTEYNVMFV